MLFFCNLFSRQDRSSINSSSEHVVMLLLGLNIIPSESAALLVADEKIGHYRHEPSMLCHKKIILKVSNRITQAGA